MMIGSRTTVPGALVALAIAALTLGAAPGFAASFIVKGDINVQGDDENVSGNVSSAGDATVKGSATVQGNANIQTNGVVETDLEVGKNTTMRRYIKVYTISYTKSSGQTPLSMGAWDMCTLTTYTITSLGKYPADRAQCQVLTTHGRQMARPWWTLVISSGSSDIDKLVCGATCVSFTDHSTSDY